jgi:uncharacterized coiled-coil DUF342 family protein
LDLKGQKMKIDNEFISRLMRAVKNEADPKLLLKLEIKDIELASSLNTQKELIDQRDVLIEQREVLTRQRDELIEQRDELTRQRDELTQQRDEIIQEKNKIDNYDSDNIKKYDTYVIFDDGEEIEYLDTQNNKIGYEKIIK